MPAIGVSVQGVDNLLELLKGLDEDVRGEVVQDGLLAGAQIVAADAAARAPRETGALAKSIRAEKRDVEPGESVAVGIKAAWYWRFPEFGTAPHELRRATVADPYGKGWTPPSTPEEAQARLDASRRRRRTMVVVGIHMGTVAQPFARPAVDENVERVLEVLGDEIRGALEARAR